MLPETKKKAHFPAGIDPDFESTPFPHNTQPKKNINNGKR